MSRRRRVLGSSPRFASSGKPLLSRRAMPASASLICGSGFVLAKEGGGLAKMLTPFKLGLGGVIGSGKQYMSWIALDDLVRTIKFSLSSHALSGPVNATSPHPVTNREFTKTLGSVLKRPTIFPMPSFAARLAFGEMADDMLIGGVRVEPHVLEAARFDFAYPQLEVALRHILT